MEINVLTLTGSLQLPLLATDPATSSSGQIWFNTSGTGSIKYTVASASVILTKTIIYPGIPTITANSYTNF
jgi:hypothetical protein